jgi:hypothetical protein
MPMGDPYKCYLERSYHSFERKEESNLLVSQYPVFCKGY